MNKTMWKREFSAEEIFSDKRVEQWSKNSESYNMHVRYGKKTDLFHLKQDLLDSFKLQVEKCRKLCSDFLSEDKNLVHVNKCMVCGAKSDIKNKELSIHGLDYIRCKNCNHRYLIERLSDEALERFYETDTVLSATLLDKKTTQARINQINKPKVEWVIEEYKRVFGKKPKKIVDIGAGAGHFVFAARELGMECYGVEPNVPSVEFAKEIFDIDLIPEDFLDIPEVCKDADIITFWAVLEHLPNFMKFMKVGNEILSKNGGGLFVMEVPRWHSLDTKIQSKYNDTVNRHLFPLSHIQIFSDSSIMNSLTMNKFVPRGAWYFGMDMYELACQLGYSSDEKVFFEDPGKFLLDLQPVIDSGFLSDTMIFSSEVK